MAYDRDDQNTTKVAELIKYDDADDLKRPLIDIILEVLDYSEAVLASKTVAQIATDLDTALSR